MNPALVSLRGVSVRFGPTIVLNNIDLDVPPGAAIAVTGANGAGKSTLLGVLSTIIRPSEGSVAVFGAPVARRDLIAVRRRIGMSAHEPGLYPELSLLENLALIARVHGDVKMSAVQALEVVGLAGAADRRASDASNGMRRRVDLARLIMTRPELLLLDEAHAGLDEAAREIIGRLVHRTCEAGGSAIVVSHDRSILEGTFGTILSLRSGEIV